MTLIVFTLAGIFLIILAACLHQILAGEVFIKALYWSIAFATTYGTGSEPSTNIEYTFTMTWMVLCITYWSAIFGAIATWIGDFFER
jgi:hypothetical protein